MKIGIIGAGFTALSAAYKLSKEGHIVTIFEKDNKPGGLAVGYKENGWEWSLEHHYHHWFTNDTFSLSLAKEIHHEVIIKKPHTNVYLNNHIYQLDSISAFLKIPGLNPLERVWHLLTLGLLFKINPLWKPLEHLKATRYLPNIIGKKAYRLIWEPQLHNKLGDYMDEVSLVWFWARIKKRTPSLAYPKGGFLLFAQRLTTAIRKQQGTLYYATEIKKIMQNNNSVDVYTDKKKYTFDKVLVTTPSYLFLQIAPQLTEDYKNKLKQLKGLGAINIVLRLKKPFFNNNTYWLSICDKTAPLMAIIDHTNFMDKKYYHNEHIVYLGNYVHPSDKRFSLSKEELLAQYDPFLKKINPDYKKNLIAFEMFKVPFAQPIIPTGYSKKIPPFVTPLSRVYLANIEQVYPWDRGTNYAIELGEKVANLICKS